jgi:Na+-driven multidrug efflux pump
MSTFREGQNQAHPNKTSTLILALIMVLMANVSIQIWLLYTTLNNALANNKDIAFPAFIASLALFLIGFFWLYYLPGGIKSRKMKKDVNLNDVYH